MSLNLFLVWELGGRICKTGQWSRVAWAPCKTAGLQGKRHTGNVRGKAALVGRVLRLGATAFFYVCAGPRGASTCRRVHTYKYMMIIIMVWTVCRMANRSRPATTSMIYVGYRTCHLQGILLASLNLTPIRSIPIPGYLL